MVGFFREGEVERGLGMERMRVEMRVLVWSPIGRLFVEWQALIQVVCNCIQ
jgi:hypothetical protein